MLVIWLYVVENKKHTLGSDNPSNSPTGKSETLSKTVDDQNVVLVDILDVLSGGDGGTIAVAGVVVSGVEFVANESGATTANVLDLGKLRVGNDSAGRVSWVRGQND